MKYFICHYFNAWDVDRLSIIIKPKISNNAYAHTILINDVIKSGTRLSLED